MEAQIKLIVGGIRFPYYLAASDRCMVWLHFSGDQRTVHGGVSECHRLDGRCNQLSRGCLAAAGPYLATDPKSTIHDRRRLTWRI